MIGATQNSHNCESAQPPANNAGPVLRAGFTDVFVTGMLMTAIVPASAHLIVGLTGLFARLTPGAHAAAETLAHHPDAPLSPKEKAPVRLTLILSRIWYVVAAAVTVSAVAGASWLIWYTHAPVAEFLAGVARCTTSWSGHSHCTWF